MLCCLEFREERKVLSKSSGLAWIMKAQNGEAGMWLTWYGAFCPQSPGFDPQHSINCVGKCILEVEAESEVPGQPGLYVTLSPKGQGPGDTGCCRGEVL